jgi:hypothetical protein
VFVCDQVVRYNEGELYDAHHDYYPVGEVAGGLRI